MGRLVKERSDDSKDISFGWAFLLVWLMLVTLFLFGYWLESL